jgi:glucokinase
MTLDPSPHQGVLCADLGGTHLRVAVLDAHGGTLEKTVIETPREDPASLVRLMKNTLEKSTLQVSAAVVGVPGPISYRDGVPLRLPNLPAWEAFVSARRLQEALGLPVLLANDADLAALGEHRFGAGRDCSDMVYVTSSTGVGAGVIVSGRLLRGRWSLAEAGHMVIDWRSGATVEDLGSGSTLARRANEDGAAVARQARDGDARSQEIFHEMAEAFATGVHNLVHCFMPERVVIGGGVSEAGDLLLRPVRQQIDSCDKGCSVRGGDIVLAERRDDAGLLGGLALWNEVKQR